MLGSGFVRSSYSRFLNQNIFILDELFYLLKRFNELELRIGTGKPELASLPSGPAEDDTVIIMDWQCPCTESFLLSLDMSQYEQFKWFFINDILEENKNLMFAVNLHYIGVGSEVFLILSECEDCAQFSIERVYKIHRHAPLTAERYGIWSNKTFNSLLNYPITSRRRQNLHKSVLRASMVITHNDSLNHLDDYRDQHIDTIAKVNFILTNHLIAFLNASVRYSIVNTWGYLNKDDGSWTGMIGELTDNKAEIGATALFFTDNRISVIQYVAMTTKTLSKIVFQSPKLSYTDNVFLLPFSRIVWICIVATVPTIAIALALVMYAEWKVPLKPHVRFEKNFLLFSTQNRFQ